jgi:hypothetical protein
MSYNDKAPYQREEKEWYTRKPARPTIVCLCGSTRFRDAFEEANLEETLAGKIVLQPGHYTHAAAENQGAVNRAAGNSRPVPGDKEIWFGPEVAQQLEELCRRKIDLADEVLVLNVGGYVGSSTAAEVAYAQSLGKQVRWLEGEVAL